LRKKGEKRNPGYVYVDRQTDTEAHDERRGCFATSMANALVISKFVSKNIELLNIY